VLAFIFSGMNQDDFIKTYFKDWKTPNTYDENYGEPPQKPGVYFLLRPFENGKNVNEILYIGSAKYLYQRYERHEVRRILTEVYGYIQFYWKEEDDYKIVEKQLIKKYQPRFNKQCR